MKKSTRITVSITEKEHDKLAEMAAIQDVSMSWLVRKAIQKYVEGSKEDQQQLPFV